MTDHDTIELTHLLVVHRRPADRAGSRVPGRVLVWLVR